jgi:phosphoglucomutase
VLLNGNQLGTLLTDYVFSGLKATGKLPAKPVFINSIVTTELHNLIAQDYGAHTERVLTGFKYIGEKIRGYEAAGTGETYVFGGEESYGFLLGSAVRDKDAVSSTAITVEMALWHLSQGRSVMDALNALYEKYGYFSDPVFSESFAGQAGLETMKAFMKGLRQSPPKELGGIAVTKTVDYLPGTTLPPSDIVQFLLADGSSVIVRPSGTEPKIKFYMSSRSAKGLKLEQAKTEVDAKIEALKKALKGMMS